MNVIQLQQGAGKTMMSALHYMNKGYPIIVPNDKRKDAIIELIKTLRAHNCVLQKPKLDKWIKIYTVDDLIANPDLVKNEEGVIIDDLDMILSQLLGVRSENILVTTN